MNLPSRIAAALLLLATVPTPGRGCAALCARMVPTAPAPIPAASLAAPIHDCCRMHGELQGPVTPAVQARSSEPRPLPAGPAVALPAVAAPRPEARPSLTPGLPLRPGPPLYTLLAVLLI